MADEIYGLGEDDVERLSQMLDEWEAGRFNTIKLVNPVGVSSPLATKIGKATGTITAISGTSPGAGPVDVWQVNTSGTLVVGVDSITAYNLYSTTYSAGDWVTLIRDPISGKYFVPQKTGTASVSVGQINPTVGAVAASTIIVDHSTGLSASVTSGVATITKDTLTVQQINPTLTVTPVTTLTFDQSSGLVLGGSAGTANCKLSLASNWATLSSAFALSLASGVHQKILTATVSVAGTYLVVATIYGTMQSANVFDSITAKIVANATGGFTNSETWVVQASSAAPANRGVGTMCDVFTLAAGDTIDMYAWRNFTGAITTSAILSDSTGSTRIQWLKIA